MSAGVAGIEAGFPAVEGCAATPLASPRALKKKTDVSIAAYFMIPAMTEKPVSATVMPRFASTRNLSKCGWRAQ
jgi:hypothetical protein